VQWSQIQIFIYSKQLLSAQVHRKLGQRPQRKGETLQEYFYALMEIVKPVNLDEESLIEYFFEVPDARANKIILNQAKTISDLKEQIEIYNKIRGLYKNEARVAEAEGFKSFDSKQELVRKCFKSGDPSHLKKDCKEKCSHNCYRCGQPGHRAAQCKIEVEVKQQSNAYAIQVENAATKPKSEKLLKLPTLDSKDSSPQAQIYAECAGTFSSN